MGYGAEAAALEQQARLGVVKRLDLAFLVDRQDHGVRRWIDVEADDVADLVGEPRIVRELELPHPMRLQAVAAPNAVNPLSGSTAGAPVSRDAPSGAFSAACACGSRSTHLPHRASTAPPRRCSSSIPATAD